MMQPSGSKIKMIALVASVFLLALAVAYVAVPADKDTIFVTERSEDGNLVYFTYTGDYGFDNYMVTGSHDLDSLYEYLSDNVTCGIRINGVNPVGCSSMCVGQDDGTGYYVGRNFDFRYSNAGVVFSDPDYGYASVSTVDLRMFGDTDEPYADMAEDVRYNAVAYIPLDGINEKGVFVCINAVNNAGPIDQDEEGKVGMFTTSALRLVLDYADSTEAAVELISQYNLNSKSNFHLFICDASGDCRTVEYSDNIMYVTETDVLTNHYLTDAGDAPLRDSSVIRYQTLMSALEESGTMTESDVRDTMRSVMQNDEDLLHYTRWSVVYDLENISVGMCLRIGDSIDWDEVYRYGLESYARPQNNEDGTVL